MSAKLSLADIKTRLCHYDTRNPDGVISYYSKEELCDEGLSEKAKENCYCDNCFNGRTILAEYIIEHSLTNESINPEK